MSQPVTSHIKLQYCLGLNLFRVARRPSPPRFKPCCVYLRLSVCPSSSGRMTQEVRSARRSNLKLVQVASCSCRQFDVTSAPQNFDSGDQRTDFLKTGRHASIQSHTTHTMTVSVVRALVDVSRRLPSQMLHLQDHNRQHGIWKGSRLSRKDHTTTTTTTTITTTTITFIHCS